MNQPFRESRLSDAAVVRFSLFLLVMLSLVACQTSTHFTPTEIAARETLKSQIANGDCRAVLDGEILNGPLGKKPWAPHYRKQAQYQCADTESKAYILIDRALAEYRSNHTNKRRVIDNFEQAYILASGLQGTPRDSIDDRINTALREISPYSYTELRKLRFNALARWWESTQAEHERDYGFQRFKKLSDWLPEAEKQETLEQNTALENGYRQLELDWLKECKVVDVYRASGIEIAEVTGGGDCIFGCRVSPPPDGKVHVKFRTGAHDLDGPRVFAYTFEAVKAGNRVRIDTRPLSDWEKKRYGAGFVAVKYWLETEAANPIVFPADLPPKPESCDKLPKYDRSQSAFRRWQQRWN